MRVLPDHGSSSVDYVEDTEPSVVDQGLAPHLVLGWNHLN